MALYLYLVFFFAVNALLQSAVCSGSKVDGTDNLGISGGKEISIEDAPFIAAIFKNYGHDIFKPVCGGSIIHKQFILTAAHCIPRFRNRNKDVTIAKVHIGTEKLYYGTVIDVEEAICHKGFSFVTTANDICLLKLSEPIEFGAKIAPAKLPDKNTDLKIGTEVNVTGWGYISNGNDHFGMVPRLRQATLAVVSKETCRNIYPTWIPTAMCAGSSEHNFCKGDSGGPLTNNGVQFGIVSYFKGNPNLVKCGSLPGVYTKVASYVDWINATITENL